MQEFINAFNSEETTAKELMEIIEKVLDKWSKVMYNKLIKWKRGNKNEVRTYQCNQRQCSSSNKDREWSKDDPGFNDCFHLH